MPLEFDDKTAAERTGELIEAYRENRDELRASIKALQALHGADLVCVALHMANLKSLAVAADMSEELKSNFVREAFALVKHFADARGVPVRQINAIAEGLWEQVNLMKTSIEEAGLPSNVPLPGTEHGD